MQDLHIPRTPRALNNTADTHTLAELHERVNALLDMPLPKEGDAWPLPLQTTLEHITDTAPEPLARAGST